jgi:basic amino acid/polyamine antiporter, APA family
VRTPAKTQLRATVGGMLLYAGIAWVLMLAISKSVSLDFNQAATWLSYNYAGEESIELAPHFLLYTGLLVQSTPLFILVAIGLVIWAYFWIPSAMMISTRAMFAWSFDRLAPERLAAVHPRYNSPYVAVIVVAILAEAFLIAYHNGIFEFLAPALAYQFVFMLTALAGVVFPYLKRTKPLWEASPVNWRFGGIPVMTICGVIGVVYFGLALYFMMTEDLLFLNTPNQLWTTGAQFAIPLVVFFVVRAFRRSRGVDIDAAFKQIPPE